MEQLVVLVSAQGKAEEEGPGEQGGRGELVVRREHGMLLRSLQWGGSNFYQQVPGSFRTITDRSFLLLKIKPVAIPEFN